MDPQVSIMDQVELVKDVTEEEYRAIQEEELLLIAHSTPVHVVSDLGCEGVTCWSRMYTGTAPVHPQDQPGVAPEGEL